MTHTVSTRPLHITTVHTILKLNCIYRMYARFHYLATEQVWKMYCEQFECVLTLCWYQDLFIERLFIRMLYLSLSHFLFHTVVQCIHICMRFVYSSKYLSACVRTILRCKCRLTVLLRVPHSIRFTVTIFIHLKTR